MGDIETPFDADDQPRATSTGGELVLIKHGRRYCFRCEPGQESALLGQLRAMAADPAVDLSAFDAAMLSHQIGARLRQRMRNV